MKYQLTGCGRDEGRKNYPMDGFKVKAKLVLVLVFEWEYAFQ